MFVRVIEAMEKYPQKIIDQVSDRAIDLQVVCFDHVKPIGTMIAPWQTVKAYLLARVTGYQLEAHVTPIH
jgi:hypothetical protein